MNSILKSSLLAFALVCLSVTSAWADTVQQQLDKAVQEAALECSNGQISVVLDQEKSIATLAGELDCALGKTAAEKAAMESEYVNEVINLITVTTN